MVYSTSCGSSESTGKTRPKALIIPTVMVLCKPKGLPIVTTSCPTLTCVESPSCTGRNSSVVTSTLTTARSLSGSVPTTLAETIVPSWNVTVMRSAPSTTCLFVTMCPRVSHTNPDPEPWRISSCGPCGKGYPGTDGTTGKITVCRCTVRMLTTDGLTCA